MSKFLKTSTFNEITNVFELIDFEFFEKFKFEIFDKTSIDVNSISINILIVLITILNEISTTKIVKVFRKI